MKVVILDLTINSNHEYKLEIPLNKEVFCDSYSDKVIIYDIIRGNRYKILCTSNKEIYKVSCVVIKVEPKENSIEIIEFNYYSTKFIINNDNCYLTKFMSEFLLCCGMNNKISCQRNDLYFETINNFEINLSNEVYNLTIIDNNNFVVLNYMNNILTPK